MKATIFKATTIATALVSLAACSGGGGGGGGSTGDGFGSAVSAQFIDAPVKGLTFATSSNSTGKTGAQGKFTCKRGEMVNFSLKGFKLGQAACGEKIFVQDLFSPVDVTAGYSWQKAASVIQSFSTGTTELDLSSANSSTLDLTSLAYNDGSFDTAVNGKVTGLGNSDLSHKNIAAAETHADSSLVDHAKVDANFAAILDSVILEEGGKVQLKASLVSGTKIGGEEYCDEKVEALMNVSKNADPAKPIYTLSTDKAISYNSPHVPSAHAECSTTHPELCFNVDSTMIPSPKIITGPKFDVAAAAVIENYRGETGLKVSSYTTVSLLASQVADAVKVSGTFYNELKVLESTTEGAVGTTIKCRFNID
ncbi:hypothetical protein [Bdellovibrio sp.]|uniref:hypothetical protein n=1 Tax=Bdellovibrio sp. TaxID=28201 RepID=UPI0032216E59